MSEAEKAKRRNEVFRRINCGTLARWVAPAEAHAKNASSEPVNDENQNVQNLPSEAPQMKQFSQHDGDIYCSQSIQTSDHFHPSESVLGPSQSNILGMESSSKSLFDVQRESTFIIFDLRSPDEYQEFRIRDAVSFHSRLINQDKFPSEIYAFKNRPDKWIVVYDVDDRFSEPWADLLVKKGFSNVMMLTGGIARFYVRFPHLVEGDIPAEFIEMAEQEHPIRMRHSRAKPSRALPGKSTLSVSTSKTGSIRMSKLPKKDLLMRQHRLNKELQRQRLSNPSKRDQQQLSHKPSEFHISKGGHGKFKKRTLNFKKKELTSKIK